ncbi:MAG: protease [Candidatus Magnetoglobus multicellularis str. Araruama]|uniref:Protease n=1 Tax=Candidatus Magnetoglobus multicellularis str. Araruama TaxID=890399 RepID=A0A1V1NWM2_9BACT|nr:MAG: protease [Candidatus Magnetoglobus multicellularis str. Araruama]
MSDPGIVGLARKLVPNLKIHLSTQANTTNIRSVEFWAQQGVKRIVLARELSINEIAQIAQNVADVEIEIFVHGALCIAYSGRCMLSAYMTNRSANRGECSQPCRWEYYLKEASRQEPLVIEEDKNGTYIMNSKDICLIEHIPLIVESNIRSIKIEGRMKSAYYVAVVTKTYAEAINLFLESPEKYKCNSAWIAELANISNRGYSTGFYFGRPGAECQRFDSSKYHKNYDFVGMTSTYYSQKQLLKIFVRNHILCGDTLEVILPGCLRPYKIVLKKFFDEQEKEMNEAHNTYTILVPCTKAIPSGAVVRRKAR